MGLASSLCRNSLPGDCDGSAEDVLAAATPRERLRSDCSPPKESSASIISTCEHMPAPCVMNLDSWPKKFSTAKTEAGITVVSDTFTFGSACEATPKKQVGACDPDFRFSPLIGEGPGGYSPHPDEEWEEEAIEYGAVWRAGDHIGRAGTPGSFNVFTDGPFVVDEVMMASSSTSQLATPRAVKRRGGQNIVETTPQFGREIQNLPGASPQYNTDEATRSALECYLDDMDISPVKSIKPRKPVSSKNTILQLGGMPATPRKSESLFNTPRSIETCSNNGACGEQLRLCCSTMTGRKCCETSH